MVACLTWLIMRAQRQAFPTHEPRMSHTCTAAAAAAEVTMRRPHHPWDLLTGSLDASVKRWNFSTGRSLRRWQMQPTDEENSSQVDCCPSIRSHCFLGICNCRSDAALRPDCSLHLGEIRKCSGSSRTCHDLQAFNPPLVHGLAVACSHWARQLGRLVAAARGDGLVSVYDADLPQALPRHTKPTKVCPGYPPSHTVTLTNAGVQQVRRPMGYLASDPFQSAAARWA